MENRRMTVQPLQIGSVQTTTNLVLSPMSGVTDCAFRTTVLEASGREAVGLLVSEFVAAEGLSRDNAQDHRDAALRGDRTAVLDPDLRRRRRPHGARGARWSRKSAPTSSTSTAAARPRRWCARGGGAQLMRTPETGCATSFARRACGRGSRSPSRSARAGTTAPATPSTSPAWSRTRARRCSRCTAARACSSTAASPTGT